jgi:hypothetical protein
MKPRTVKGQDCSESWFLSLLRNNFPFLKNGEEMLYFCLFFLGELKFYFFFSEKVLHIIKETTPKTFPTN